MPLAHPLAVGSFDLLCAAIDGDSEELAGGGVGRGREYGLVAVGIVGRRFETWWGLVLCPRGCFVGRVLHPARGVASCDCGCVTTADEVRGTTPGVREGQYPKAVEFLKGVPSNLVLVLQHMPKPTVLNGCRNTERPCFFKEERVEVGIFSQQLLNLAGKWPVSLRWGGVWRGDGATAFVRLCVGAAVGMELTLH